MIAARRIVKRYGQGDPVIAHADFQVGRGQCVVVSAEPRGGASTLLRMLSGLLAPTSGSVEIDGQDIHAARSRGAAGIAFADGWVDPAGELTVGEFLRFSGCDPSAAERAGVGARTPLRQLSIEDRRAVSAAGALGSGRALVILDGVLPHDEAAPLLTWAGERAAAGAVVIATGTPAHAHALGGRLLRLERGRLS